MPPSDPFDDDPADTCTAIMQATYRALSEHGYTGLTIQRIGDEFDRSKSLLYHHYDGKDDLMLDFLAFMLDYHRETVSEWETDDPETELRSLVDHFFTRDREDDEFGAAMVELRAQAAHDEAYCDHFTRSDALFRDRIAETVAQGVEQGDFRAVDPEAVAEHLLTAIVGRTTRRTTADAAAALESLRAELHRYIDDSLLAEGST
ncbi:TetR/AcrR family transcriptional regulator [Halostella sp. PRR32]|uniref:TetR/AcrR family transcriptional regulator n=1 Tax=Halostella sp. PRR32 TaxID=3098147 RepID=UPI002B1CF887|nr:TetR/AcrR family transcriptional regulator [Halostella sp. PRR32]